MSHFIIDNTKLLLAQSKSCEDVAILLVEGGDNNLISDEAGKRAKHWSIASVSYGHNAYLESMIPYFSDINGGMIKIPSLGSYTSGSQAINLGAKGFTRLCNLWKKAQRVDYVLPEHNEWEEKDHLKIISFVNTLDFTSSYISKWHDTKAMCYTYKYRSELSKQLLGIKHLIKNFKNVDNVEFLSDKFVDEIEWQKKSGDIEQLADVFNSFSRWSIYAIKHKQINIDALKFHFESLLCYYDDYILRVFKAHPEASKECLNTYPELLESVGINFQDRNSENKEKYQNIKDNFAALCDSFIKTNLEDIEKEKALYSRDGSSIITSVVGMFAENAYYSNTNKMFIKLFKEHEVKFNYFLEYQAILCADDEVLLFEHIDTIKSSLLKQKHIAGHSTRKRNHFNSNIFEIEKFLKFIDEFITSINKTDKAA